MPHIQELAVVTVAEMVVQVLPLEAMEEGQVVRQAEAVAEAIMLLIKLEAQGAVAKSESLVGR